MRLFSPINEGEYETTSTIMAIKETKLQFFLLFFSLQVLMKFPKKFAQLQIYSTLSQRLDLAASEIMQVMSTSVYCPLTLIRHIVIQMLQEWVRHGGTRQRLLEIAQAFHFNDVADKIATGNYS